MNNINIFYHLYNFNDGIKRFENFYNLVNKSGLISKIDSINLNLVGQKDESIKNFPKIKLTYSENSKNESTTLNLLRNFCIQNKNGISFYAHSKGAKRSLDKNINKTALQDWIDYLHFFNVEKHDECIRVLTTTSANTCGVDFRATHYSGNFWWASNEYLATTQPCKDDYMYCELNFLISGKEHRPHQIHSPRIQWPKFLHENYPKEEYIF